MKLKDIAPCNCAKWGSMHRFGSRDDYYSFVAKIKVLTSTGVMVKVQPPKGENPDCEYYFCNKCRRVWRIAEPDPPFRGYYQQVNVS